MAATEPFRRSPAILVTIAQAGVRVSATRATRAHPLKYADLLLLSELDRPHTDLDDVIAQVASRSGTTATALQPTARLLRDLGPLGLVPSNTGADAGLYPLEAPGADAGHTASLPAARIDADPRTTYLLPTPVHVVPEGPLFAFYHHDGDRVIELTARELIATAGFRWPATIDGAYENQRVELGADAFTAAEMADLTSVLLGAELLLAMTEEEYLENSVVGRSQQIGTAAMARLRDLVAKGDEEAAERARARAERRSTNSPVKPFVIPYYKVRDFAPLALGMIMATAMAHDDGALRKLYEFEPNWTARKSSLRTLLSEAPGVVLFSSYVWSHADNLAISAMVKQTSPDSITVHGGPDVPSRAGEDAAYLRAHPYIDIIARNEGEYTAAEILAALDGNLTGRKGTLPDLRRVTGITYRVGEQIIRTDDRERIADLDALPSPYLAGLFDSFAEGRLSGFTIETNRGCPYGCTFCDWGSATRSRIRKFSMERVLAELDWAASKHMPRAFIADANFGILPRDLEIAEHIAHLKRTYGYPRDFGTNYAKNSTTELKAIVQTFADAGVIADGLAALQTTDPDTLAVIRRSNIKVSEYHKLAQTFRDAGLPFFIELMLGLPGSTTETFKTDLQYAVECEAGARIWRTEMLVNSPMSDPDYVEKYELATEDVQATHVRVKRKMLVSSSTYTQDDMHAMSSLAGTFRVGENYGTLRFISRFVRQDAGLPEAEFYARVDRAVHAGPWLYPSLAWATETLPEMLLAPASWARYYDDLHRLCIGELDLADTSALRATLRAQRALMPAHGRTFPEEVKLEHDFGAWFTGILDAKRSEGDWCLVVPPLSSFGPATFVVDDPTDICGSGIGFGIEDDLHGGWELDSVVARPVSKRHISIE